MEWTLIFLPLAVGVGLVLMFKTGDAMVAWMKRTGRAS